MSTQMFSMRRSIRSGTKGRTNMTTGVDSEMEAMHAPMGRRKFLALGGGAVAALASTVGVATAVIRAGGATPSPRSLAPVGLDPATGREPGAVLPAPLGVRHFALGATDGWVSMPSASNGFVGPTRGAQAVGAYFPDPLADPANTNLYAFCFRNVTGLNQSQVAAQKGRTQICAPLFYSTVGEEIWVTLSNLGLTLRPDLVDSHTLHWHGFRNAIPFYDGVPESSISVPIGRNFTYVYRPEDAGTYMYHCHFEDVEHVTMGMHGIVFVKPSPSDTAGLAAGQQKAYGHRDGDVNNESVYDREFSIMLSEVDTRAHFNDAHIQATDWTDFQADFWTMNGRAYPDTLEPNGVRDAEGQMLAQRSGGIDANGNAILTTLTDYATEESRLFANPLSSLVQCAPGERILIRIANLGFLDHSIVFPGLSIDVLGRDARFVPGSAQRLATDSIQVGPGESRDVFFTAPDEPGDYAFYDRGMSHYTGSADGTDSWVGGQRSAVRVIADLAPQLKPNGWAGEPLWHGEQPLVANHPAPTVAATGSKINTGPNAGRGTFVTGSVTVEAQNPGTFLSKLWWAQTNVNASQPAPTSSAWRSADFDAANAFRIRTAGGAAATRKYWLLAQDSGGVTNAPFSVTI